MIPKPRRATAALFALAAAGALAAGIGRYRVTSPEQPAERPDDVALRNADIRFYAARVARDPLGAADRAQLAGLYLQRARESGDFTDFRRAEEAARGSLAIREARNGRAQLVLASSLLAQHRFSEALVEARALVARDPDEVAYRALLGEVELEMGDYAAARATLERLTGQRGHLAVAPRLARWAEILGSPDQARRLLLAARDEAARRPDLPVEQSAWFHLRVGDLELRTGRLAEARRTLEAGLAVAPGDHRLLAAMARLESVRGRWKRALDYAERAAARVAEPATLGLIGDAHAALGDSAAAERWYAAVENLVREQPEPFNRAWTLFRLDHDRHLPETVALLRGEIEVRRDVYGYDQLAWGLYKLGDWEAARAASDSARRLGTRDAAIYFHAGLIEDALGSPARARQYLEQALAINPHFHPRFPAIARAILARLDHAGGRS